MLFLLFFFFNDTATTEIYTLSLHDALPILTPIRSPDGTRLAYSSLGEGSLLVCLPGGPMLPAEYLGDLGGLAAHRSLVLLDLRGTGHSAVPADPDGRRCDRQVPDVEALRTHLGLERLDLLAHSAGAPLALLYAVRHPDRVASLTLVTPSPRVVGLAVTDADRREVAEQRRDEPWFAAAYAAFERIWPGEATDADWTAIAPFLHGRWEDRKSTRLNSSHSNISYAVFCLKKKNLR